MAYDPHDTASIPVGTKVIALNGEVLGTVREAHAHYVFIDQEQKYLDLELPVHAIERLTGDGLHISLNRGAMTTVNHEETVHRETVDPETDE
jgi:hypothetical protein